ncbi:hypothetical protein [Streptomyces sp. MUSC 14]|uniref:hypothetical protein n=1 Tax=Streptomyces sp. MUSC 14 TaxID=1354889 RepID=UPI0011607C6F|nr:hypothetical protein [Streptomyces sp. MUSC 14]
MILAMSPREAFPLLEDRWKGSVSPDAGWTTSAPPRQPGASGKPESRRRRTGSEGPIDTSGHRPGQAGVEALQYIDDRFFPRGYLAGARADNGRKPENFQLPLHAMGYEPVYDNASDPLGVQAGFADAQLIGGKTGTARAPRGLSPRPVPLKPRTLHRGLHVPLVDPEPDPADPPRCTQRTIMIP